MARRGEGKAEEEEGEMAIWGEKKGEGEGRGEEGKERVRVISGEGRRGRKGRRVGGMMREGG